MNFENKVVLITGASSGIGKALALQLASKKCRLVLISRRTNLIYEYLQTVSFSCEPLVIKCDVGNKEEVALAVQTAKEKFGPTDVAILNAGVGFHVDVENYDSALADETYKTNLLGVIYFVEQLLPDYISRRSGLIAGVSSLADNRGFSRSGFYSSSKAALTFYLEGLSIDLKKYNVRVSTIRPGFIDTPINSKNNYPMPFIMQPEDAARIIIKGIEKGKRYIQFPWQMVLLTGIIGLLPGQFYEWLAAKSKLG